MARNTLAGTKKGKSESAIFFQTHPKSRAKKDAYNKAYHSTAERKKYRAKLTAARKKLGVYGKKNGKDLSHTKTGKLVLESQSKNRARNGRGGTARLK